MALTSPTKARARGCYDSRARSIVSRSLDPMRTTPFSCLFVGLWCIALPVTAEARPWLDSLDDALRSARERDQLILVDLYADWCGWCKRLEQDVFSTQTFQDYASNFVLLRVDTEDGAEGTRLQEQYEAYSLPTMLVLDHRKVKIGQIAGYAPVDGFIDHIEQEIAVYRELESGYAQFGDSKDLRALAVLAEEFHNRGDGRRASHLYRRMLSLGELTSSGETMTRIQLVDALRVAGRFDDAVSELAAAKSEAVRGGEAALLERLDLLSAQIAMDRGDCLQARRALETFLEKHPNSGWKRYARQTLASLMREGEQCT